MKEIKVNLKERSYSIVIDESALQYVKSFLSSNYHGREAVVITNRKIWRLWGKSFSSSLKDLNFSVIFIKDSEEAKSFSSFETVVSKIARIDDKMRSVVVIAFGGGVVGDIAGFVASSYRRGVPVIQVPTTLLAQIDSSIGGKTAINLSMGKNLIGAYHQPVLVAINPVFLKTLPIKQVKDGLSEAIKYGVIKDRMLFRFLEDSVNKQIDWQFLIERCVKIKADVVSRDEKEVLGLRFILNYGHTIGHAIENAAGYGVYSHGEAVAIGMVCANDIACELGLLVKKDALRIESLINAYKLPICYNNGKLSLNSVYKALLHDKKFAGGCANFVLPRRIGKIELVRGVDLKLVKDVLKKRGC